LTLASIILNECYGTVVIENFGKQGKEVDRQ